MTWKPEPLGVIDTVTIAAKMVHETVRGFRNTQHELFPELSEPGFQLIPPWDEAPDVQTEAARGMVQYILANQHHELKKRAKELDTDAGAVGLVAAERALATMGITVCEQPECDHTGVGGVQ